MGREATVREPADFVITVYNEDLRKLVVTVGSCLRQSHAGRVIVVDDGSRASVAAPVGDPRVTVVRLAVNSGISAARNVGISKTSSPYVAFVNVEIELDAGWLNATALVLDRNPAAGAAFTATRLPNPTRCWTRWRAAYHEEPVPPADGPAKFAPGHAVLFRRAALEAIGGYDERWVRCHEDVDICRRLKKAGWTTIYTSASMCVSHQVNGPWLLGRKEATRAVRCGNERVGFAAGCWAVLRRGGLRLGSSLFHRRWAAIGVEPLITLVAFWEVIKIVRR